MPTNLSVSTVVERLRGKYPNARYELDWTTPLELLVATILAAQCTDERVNKVTPALFKRYRTARDYAQADTAELEELIRPTGTYRNKAKAIQGACAAIADRFRGEVPRSIEEMITLPGVARKTANVVLNTAFDIPSGVIVDTHVARVSQRMKLTKEEDPPRIEQDLMKSVPQRDWTFFGPAMVLHGRYTCKAKDPACDGCLFADACPSSTAPAAAPESEPPPPVKPKAAPKTAKKKAAPARASDDDADDAPAASPPARRGDAGGDGLPPIPASWQSVLADEVEKPYYAQLSRFVTEERRAHQVFPPREDVFNALSLTPYDRVSVVLLGQDPYHDDNQAHGLCFSVRPGIAPPPSLVNMYKELKSDVGFRIPNHGYLVSWAKQGMLMLNAVLTVRAHSPNSHKSQGWETFTDAVLKRVSDKRDPVVFVLWGAYAQKKAKLVDTSRHVVIQTAHPSPLSARAGFFGSRVFSRINEELRKLGKPEIDWQLEDL